MGNIHPKRIYYICSIPPLPHYLEAFGYKHFEAASYDIYWIEDNFYFKNAPIILHHLTNNDKTDLTHADLKSLLRSLNKTDIVFCTLNYELKSHRIFRALYYSKCSFVYVTSNPIPIVHYNENQNKVTSLKWAFLSIKSACLKIIHKPKLFLDYIIRIIPSSLLLERRAEFALQMGGSVLETTKKPIACNANVLRTHSTDYDICLSLQCSTPRNDHILFLDENLPYHSDFLADKEAFPVTPTNYFKSLMSFFLRLEKQYTLPVVVAAHPKASLETYRKHFKGIEIIQGNTCDLVRRAAIVSGHASTSLHYAVIFNKPICLLATDELEASGYMDNIRSFAKSLNCHVINVDKCENFNKVDVCIDKMRYNQIMRLFIKDSSSAPSNTYSQFIPWIEAQIGAGNTFDIRD